MREICGIIDFSRKNVAFDTLLQMWRASAPLGRGFSYINFGVALACERDERISAIHRATASENRILMLGENKCNFSANELLYIYKKEDRFRKRGQKASFSRQARQSRCHGWLSSDMKDPHFRICKVIHLPKNCICSLQA